MKEPFAQGCLFTTVNAPSQVFFFFLLLSLDVISPCWEILGGGGLEQDSVTCSSFVLPMTL